MPSRDVDALAIESNAIGLRPGRAATPAVASPTSPTCHTHRHGRRSRGVPRRTRCAATRTTTRRRSATDRRRARTSGHGVRYASTRRSSTARRDRVDADSSTPGRRSSRPRPSVRPRPPKRPATRRSTRRGASPAFPTVSLPFAWTADGLAARGATRRRAAGARTTCSRRRRWLERVDRFRAPAAAAMMASHVVRGRARHPVRRQPLPGAEQAGRVADHALRRQGGDRRPAREGVPQGEVPASPATCSSASSTGSTSR